MKKYPPQLHCKAAQRSIPQCRENFLRLNPELREIFSRMDFIQYNLSASGYALPGKGAYSVLTENGFDF